jgi:hypothetical protein
MSEASIWLRRYEDELIRAGIDADVIENQLEGIAASFGRPAGGAILGVNALDNLRSRLADIGALA